MELTQLLSDIQQKLKAPKNQRNEFGKYNYRSCEDILEAVKPLLNGAVLVISDDLVNFNDRYYVKATATIRTNDSEIVSTAFARETDAKKGMDSAQITGAASSYARKYALNGLFLIDDTKDPDTQDNSKQQANSDFKRKPPVSNTRPAAKKRNGENEWFSHCNALQKGKLFHIAGQNGVEETELGEIFNRYFNSETPINKENIDALIENFENVAGAFREGSL